VDHAHHPSLHAFPTRRSSDLAPLRRLIRKEPQGELFSWAFLFDSSRQYGLFFEENFLNIVYNLLRRISLPKWISYRCHLIISERSEEHTSELQSRFDLVCRLL